jgi:hypothetical protein
MTSIKYGDGAQMLLKYHKDKQFLSEITHLNGSKTEYTYSADCEKDYRTIILQKNNKDSLISSGFRRWLNKTKENGVT